MSFKSHRLKGLVSTLLLVIIPIMFGIASGSLLLSGLSFNINTYLLIVNIVSHIVVFILFIMAMRGFAEYYNDSKIFKNSLYAVIMGITGIITAPIVSYIVDLFSPNILFLVLILVYMTVIAIPTGVFYRNAFYALEEKSGQQHFKHAGWLMFIGGITTVIVIGVFVIFLGRMFATLEFYSMKPKSS